MNPKSISELEAIITTAHGAVAAQENRYLSELRLSADRWFVGLELFLLGTGAVPRFFGLSLVRDYLVGNRSEIPQKNRAEIRQRLFAWLLSACAAGNNTTIPPYILNNIATVLARLVKLDYPHEWPTAFTDILSLSRMGSLLGFNVAVRVVVELDVEVVMFDDRRNAEEIAHNTLIKDTMRQHNVVKDIVEFLCQSITVLRGTGGGGSSSGAGMGAGAGGGIGATGDEERKKLVRRCLHALSTLIGWVDVSLVANSNTLSLLYDCMRADRDLAAVACTCLFELVKKGMDPVSKVALLQSIDLFNVLRQIPLDLSSGGSGGDDDDDDDDDEDSDTEGDAGTSWMARSNAASGDYDGDEQSYDEVLAALMDTLFQEVTACWGLYEEHVLQIVPPPPPNNASPTASRSKRAGSGADAMGGTAGAAPPVDMNALRGLGGVAAAMLHQCVPLLLTLLTSPENTVYTQVIPSLSKLLALFKQQQSYESKLKEFDAQHANQQKAARCFIASDYVASKPDMLMCIYKAMQYRASFKFDLKDEDDIEEMESKKQARKLFVNYCRVCPDMCSQLITAVLMQQPQPLSKAPFPPLEAALRLVYAFGEGLSAQQSAQYLSGNDSAFNQLLRTLHETDVAQHRHSQVVLSYFEVCPRYVRHTSVQSLCQIATNLLAHGLRHRSDLQVRVRSAYLFLKMVEGMESRAATLVPIIGSLGDLMLLDASRMQIAATGNESGQGSALLTEAAELHLLEAVGVITSCSGGNADANIRQLQQRLLNDMIDVLVKQIQSVLQHPQAARFEKEICVIVTHKIGSISSLSKGYSHKLHPHAKEGFQRACEYGVVPCVNAFGRYPQFRAKIIVLIHRMVSSIGQDVLVSLVSPCILCLFQHADTSRDTDMAVQMLNQLMIEYGNRTVPLINVLLPIIMDKYGALIKDLEDTRLGALNGGPVSGGAGSTSGGSPAAPLVPQHIESEKNSMLKQFLTFMQHIAANSCDAVLFTNTLSSAASVTSASSTAASSSSGNNGGSGPALSSDASKGSNLQRLDGIFMLFLQILGDSTFIHSSNAASSSGGSSARSTLNITLPLKKSVINILCGLSKSWLVPNAAGIAYCSSSAGHVIAAFRKMLFEQILPLLLTSSANPSVIPTTDAQGQAVVADIGGLLWTIVTASSSDASSSGGHGNTPAVREVLNFLEGALLPGIGWPAAMTGELITQLRSCYDPSSLASGMQGGSAPAPTSIGAFKEFFKKLIKAFVASKGGGGGMK